MEELNVNAIVADEEVKTSRKTLIDYILPEDYDRYNELLAKAEEAKANAPKKERGPLTPEQKKKQAENRLKKAQEQLAKLLADAGIAEDDAE